MKYLNAHNLISTYIPKDNIEQAYKQQMLKLLESNSNCFERNCRVGHFTASAFLLNKEKTHALLMLHVKLGEWMQLGGHCDGNDDLLEVAIKEAQEESGILEIKPVSNNIYDIDIHLIPTNQKEEIHYHFDVRFLLRAYDHNSFVKNHESNELRWVALNKNNIPTNNYSVIKMFDKFKSFERR